MRRTSGALFLLAATACAPDELPDQGYSRTVLTRDAKNPMALAVTPDSDAYFIERTGEVQLLRRSTGLFLDSFVTGPYCSPQQIIALRQKE